MSNSKAILLFIAVLILAGGIYLPDAVEQYVTERIEQYIEENPAQVYASATAGIKLLQAQAEEAKKALVLSLSEELTNDPKDPVIKSKMDHDTTIVMFSDFNCGYCKRSHPELMAVLATDNKVRLVIKEFPVLGPLSEYAAIVAQSIQNIDPEKYQVFQTMMFESEFADQRDILQIAMEAGINIDDLSSEIENPDHIAKLSKNLDIASKLEINGTPAFIIDGTIFPGAVPAQTLLDAVEESRLNRQKTS